MKPKLLFLTSDSSNPTISNLIDELKISFDVLIISDAKDSTIDSSTFFYFKYKYKFFEKFLLLFSKQIDSRQEILFSKRNVYRKYKRLLDIASTFKHLINRFINLPYYSDITFFLFKNFNKFDNILNNCDAVLTDANFRHTFYLNPLIARCKKIKKPIYSIVLSWDNPQYSTLNRFSSKYFVWNEINKKEMQKYYGIDSKKFIISGSLIHDYLLENKEFLSKKLDNQKVSEKQNLRIMYAGVFPETDTKMINEEINFVISLSKMIEDIYPDSKLIFRTYPSRGGKNVYSKLENVSHIQIYRHEKFHTVSRLGNDLESISFNSDEKKKISEFFDTDLLISSGSTYTLEYAFSKKPILHLHAESLMKERNNHFNFFQRLYVYGHLDHLSPENFEENLIYNFDDLKRKLKSLQNLKESGYSEYLMQFCNSGISSSSKGIIRKNIKYD